MGLFCNKLSTGALLAAMPPAWVASAVPAGGLATLDRIDSGTSQLISSRENGCEAGKTTTFDKK
jgi:hypothetical protein